MVSEECAFNFGAIHIMSKITYALCEISIANAANCHQESPVIVYMCDAISEKLIDLLPANHYMNSGFYSNIHSLQTLPLV